MMKLVECIPNFSVSRERDEAAFNALVDTGNTLTDPVTGRPVMVAESISASSQRMRCLARSHGLVLRYGFSDGAMAAIFSISSVFSS
mgnify:CR=1 FL=1